MADGDDMLVRQLGDKRAIGEVKARYFRNMDRRDWAAMDDVFAPEATMDMRPAMAELVRAGMPVDPDGGFIEGREAIVTAMSGSLVGTVTVHHGHMGEIDLIDADHAQAIWPMEDIVVLPEGAPIGKLRGYGHYHEEYRRCEDGCWRITALKLTRLLVELI